ncbi:MAG: translation initiation factor IF-2 [Dehalococcoidia bacterium]|nr:translation initiation factor IF-2 [Dehalococcoidia bacterium]
MTTDQPENLNQEQESKDPVSLPLIISVGDLAETLNESQVDVIKSLMKLGVMASVNQEIDFALSARVAQSFEIPVLKPKESIDNTSALNIGSSIDIIEKNTGENRAPVITVLGHVDHGKTTLLDAIRQTNEVDNEHGGITQKIGAYQVKYNNSEMTFIDTPGHQAFSSMRVSGTSVTDIVVLVVAADDGLMPQTIESINHAKNAKVPMIVAINKCDLEGSDIDRIKSQLTEHEIIVEDYGGDVLAVQVSALKRDGIDTLLDSISLLSEINEFQSNSNIPGKGVIIESYNDPKKGSISTILVKSGSFKRGDILVSGNNSGKIRQMIDGYGSEINTAKPSTPIQVMGISGINNIGDVVEVVKDDKQARKIIQQRSRTKQTSNNKITTLSQVVKRAKASKENEINIVIKTGSNGALTAVEQVVNDLTSEEIQVKIISGSVGAVTESDVMLASSAEDCIIVAFQTIVENGAKSQSEMNNIPIRTFDIIYTLVDEIKEIIEGLKGQEKSEVNIGSARVLEVFPRGKVQNIAGIRVTDGNILRNARIRVVRNNETIFDGGVESMRHLKQNVTELKNNIEGGIVLNGFHDIEIDDTIESYELK